MLPKNALALVSSIFDIHYLDITMKVYQKSPFLRNTEMKF